MLNAVGFAIHLAGSDVGMRDQIQLPQAVFSRSPLRFDAALLGQLNPIAAVRDGDMITLDAVKGEISVALSDAELEARKADWKGPRETIYASGAIWKFAQQVGKARFGAVTHPGAKAEKHVYADL